METKKENKMVKFLKLSLVVILAASWFVSSFKSVLF